jgi:RHH-type rel operon transcriptional repressor/antitoxin RelB
MNPAISIRLPKDLVDKLNSLANETERSRADIIKEALELYIEDYADLQIALNRLNDKTDTILSCRDFKKAI